MSVEKIAAFLLERDEALEPGEADADEREASAEAIMEIVSPTPAADLYERAKVFATRDKPSTSYLQRRLEIGYNQAAGLIERMEAEGLISRSYSAGKRTILKPYVKPSPTPASAANSEAVAWRIDDLILLKAEPRFTTDREHARRMDEYRYEGERTARVTTLYAQPHPSQQVDPRLIEWGYADLEGAIVDLGRLLDDRDAIADPSQQAGTEAAHGAFQVIMTMTDPATPATAWETLKSVREIVRARMDARLDERIVAGQARERVATVLWERFAPEHDEDPANALRGAYPLIADAILAALNTSESR